ncbi:MAG TPA: hypothetical protein VLK56_03570 [Solirubrobacterales bacterium]|nr:hypothetical protein [Solirubrobacterales bacterium]
MRPRMWLAGTVVAAALACSTAAADASPPLPANLQVAGGSDAWHGQNQFDITWTNPPLDGSPLTATHYRIRDPQGTTIRETWMAWVSDGIDGIELPAVPGEYSIEVWLEDAAGEQGPAATARLRFDDTRPAAIQPQPVPGWIGRTAFPIHVRLGHPSGPLPMSGIRGYAVSIDAAADGPAPCLAPDRCSDAETTLRGGVNGDELRIAALLEGISHLHAVAVSGSGMKSATSGTAVLRVDTTDPVTRLTGTPVGWTNRTASLTANAADGGSGMEADGEGRPPFTAIRVDGGAPQIGLGDSAAADVIGEGVHRIEYYARDAAGNVDDGAQSNGIADGLPRTAWVRIDRTPPSTGFANSQNPSDPDLLRVRIADPLSGPDLARGWIGVRPAGSGDRFEPLPPASPQGGALCARWNSDRYPPGDYEFRAIGYDVAGNAAVTTRRLNGGPMVLSNPLKAATALRAAFPRRGPQRTVRYGRGVLFSGRLTTGTDSPLSGVPVQIVERFAAGARPQERVVTVRTAGDGSFAIHTAPGPSRTVVASFDGSPTLARSSSDTLQLHVRSLVRLQASSAIARVGGAPLVFRGQVVAPPGAIPPVGKSVQLQFRLPGLPWAEFRTIQTDRNGRFRYAYRFSDNDSRGVRFQFRAYAPAQDDWPYEPNGSRPVLVRGI